jgi:hypothetical protein
MPPIDKFTFYFVLFLFETIANISLIGYNVNIIII